VKQTIVVSEEAFQHFLDACDNPKPPTQKLIDLMRGSRAKALSELAELDADLVLAHRQGEKE
jgi:uncharacterized protein (DUF1778 family)